MSKQANTAVFTCTCTHAYQDARYGYRMRLFNGVRGKDKRNIVGFRCTICLAKK